MSVANELYGFIYCEVKMVYRECHEKSVDTLMGAGGKRIEKDE